MPADEAGVRFGRFGETALWILVALASEPMRPTRLLDEVRRLDGRVGPGSFFGAVARLEWRGLIEPVANGEDRRGYRLSQPWRTHQESNPEGHQQ